MIGNGAAATLLLLLCVVSVAHGASYSKIETAKECNCPDMLLGAGMSEDSCANACAAKTGCEFFIFGGGSILGFSVGKCYWEKTTNASCPEGFNYGPYDFYQMGAGAKATAPAPTKALNEQCTTDSECISVNLLCLPPTLIPAHPHQQPTSPSFRMILTSSCLLQGWCSTMSTAATQQCLPTGAHRNWPDSSPEVSPTYKA